MAEGTPAPPTEPAAPPSEGAVAEHEAVAAVRKVLGHHLRCELSDGRVVLGKFACFDKQQNILLHQAYEWHKERDRQLGTVIVPRKHLAACVVAVESSRSDADAATTNV